MQRTRKRERNKVFTIPSTSFLSAHPSPAPSRKQIQQKFRQIYELWKTSIQTNITTAKIQNTQEIKRTLFNQTKRDKTCTFLRKCSFSSYVQQYNRKQLNQKNLKKKKKNKSNNTTTAAATLLLLRAGSTTTATAATTVATTLTTISTTANNINNKSPAKRKSNSKLFLLHSHDYSPNTVKYSGVHADVIHQRLLVLSFLLKGKKAKHKREAVSGH